MSKPVSGNPFFRIEQSPNTSGVVDVFNAQPLNDSILWRRLTLPSSYLSKDRSLELLKKLVEKVLGIVQSDADVSNKLTLCAEQYRNIPAMVPVFKQVASKDLLSFEIVLDSRLYYLESVIFSSRVDANEELLTKQLITSFVPENIQLDSLQDNNDPYLGGLNVTKDRIIEDALLQKSHQWIQRFFLSKILIVELIHHLTEQALLENISEEDSLTSKKAALNSFLLNNVFNSLDHVEEFVECHLKCLYLLDSADFAKLTDELKQSALSLEFTRNPSDCLVRVIEHCIQSLKDVREDLTDSLAEWYKSTPTQAKIIVLDFTIETLANELMAKKASEHQNFIRSINAKSLKARVEVASSTLIANTLKNISYFITQNVTITHTLQNLRTKFNVVKPAITALLEKAVNYLFLSDSNQTLLISLNFNQEGINVSSSTFFLITNRFLTIGKLDIDLGNVTFEITPVTTASFLLFAERVTGLTIRTNNQLASIQDRLLDYRNLQTIALNDVSVSNEILVTLSKLPKLETIELINCRVDIGSLRTNLNLAGLRKIKIADNLFSLTHLSALISEINEIVPQGSFIELHLDGCNLLHSDLEPFRENEKFLLFHNSFLKE